MGCDGACVAPDRLLPVWEKRNAVSLFYINGCFLVSWHNYSCIARQSKILKKNSERMSEQLRKRIRFWIRGHGRGPMRFLRGVPNRISFVFNPASPANPRWRSRWRRRYGLGMAKPRAAGPAARAFFVPRDVRYRAASPKRMGDDTADRDAIVWSVCAAWLQHDCRGHATIFRKAAIGRVSDSGETPTSRCRRRRAGRV